MPKITHFGQPSTGGAAPAAPVSSGYVPRLPVLGSPVSARAIGRAYTNTSVVATQTSRVKHVITEDCAGIALFFASWGNGEAPQTVDATIKAAVEIGSAILPITFDGVRTRTLAAGGSARSDVLGVNLRKGDVIYVRTARTIVPGTWLQNCSLLGVTAGEAVLDSDAVDSAASAFTAAGSDGSTLAWSAHAVVSTGVKAARSVAIIGDSVSNGQNESAREFGGYMLRSLPDGVGVIRANNGGGTVKQYVSNSVNGGSALRRLPVACAARYAWVEFGINDVNAGDSLATIQANLTRLWNSLAAAGLIVVQSTVTLWTTASTDGWLTEAGQTVHANNAVRVQLNDWIRTKPAPLAAVFDMADVVETSRNSGKWRVDPVSGVALTTDGIHPSTAGHVLVADALRAQVAGVLV